MRFKLDLMRLRQHAIVKVGEWSPESRLNISDRSVFFDASPMNVTLVAITILVSSSFSGDSFNFNNVLFIRRRCPTS